MNYLTRHKSLHTASGKLSALSKKHEREIYVIESDGWFMTVGDPQGNEVLDSLYVQYPRCQYSGVVLDTYTATTADEIKAWLDIQDNWRYGKQALAIVAEQMHGEDVDIDAFVAAADRIVQEKQREWSIEYAKRDYRQTFGEDLPENAIKLIAAGGNYWHNYQRCRVYFNSLVSLVYPTLRITRYKLGNIMHAELDGETISNSAAWRLIGDVMGGQLYYDVREHEFVAERMSEEHAEIALGTIKRVAGVQI